MRTEIRFFLKMMVAVFILVAGAMSAQAADKYSSGGKTWDTTTSNWGTNSGSYSGDTWDNAAPDSAIFEGTPGAVALSTGITVSNITFTSASGGYTIGGDTLNFVSGGVIDQTIQNISHTITAPITGVPPSVRIADGTTSDKGLVFAPTNGTQVLGTCTIPYNDATTGDKCGLTLSGTTTGNSVSKIQAEHNWGFIHKTGSGTWTLGDADVGSIYVYEGRLVLNGTFTKSYNGLVFGGGTLAGTGTIANMPLTVPRRSTLAPGDPTGTLTINGNLNLQAESTTAIEIVGDGAAVSKVAVTGTVTIAGNIDVTGLVGVTVGNEITIIDNDGADAVSGAFFELSPADLIVNYAGGDGNDVTVTRSATPVNPVTFYWDGTKTAIDGASDGGAGTWDLATQNWDDGSARIAWPDSALGDKAVFLTAGGAVDLQSDITLGQMLIGGNDSYVFGSNPESQTLHFVGAKNIIVDKVHTTIRSGIMGSPDIHHYGGFQKVVYLDPDAVSMTIGTITIGEDTTSNPWLYLRGTTTGNSIMDIQSPHNWTFLQKEDSGTWSIGEMHIYNVTLASGTLVANGAWDVRSTFIFTGGTLKGTGTITKAITVPVAGTLAPGDPVGTLTITNANCTIFGTNAIAFSGAACSKLMVYGDLNVSAGTLDVDASGASGNEFLIASCTGTLTGPFAATNGLPGGWTVDYGTTAITLTPPPAGTVLIIR